jgi:molybdopterin converting factor small subunit
VIFVVIAEANRFYEQDDKRYQLKDNKLFLSWLDDVTSKGYEKFIDIDELQDFIDKLVNWYEFKYPEKELEFYEGTRYLNFYDIRSISKSMNVRQLLYRLTHNQLCLMECGYRAKSWGQSPIYENGKEVGFNTCIFMHVIEKNAKEEEALYGRLPYFFITVDYLSGLVTVDSELRKYVGSRDTISLEVLTNRFSTYYSDSLGIEELEKCLFNHECDIELRNKILELVSLKLLYSRNTIPERGYIRANRFINEFNKKFNLNLSTYAIDEAINRDYTNGEKWVDVLKSYTDEYGDIHDYWTIENIGKEEIIDLPTEDKGIKKLIKRILKK